MQVLTRSIFFFSLISAAAGAESELRWLRITLEPLPERDPATVLLAHDDTEVRRVMIDDLGVTATLVESSEVGPDTITMDLVIDHGGLRQNRKTVRARSTSKPLRIELQIEGDAVTGKFTGQWRKSWKRMDSIEVSGQVNGVVDLPSASPVSPDASWPSYLGPNQNFSGGPAERPIIEDFNEARLVWISEYIGAPEAGSHRYGSCAGVLSAAGGASPLLAHGRIYQFRYQASGDAVQEPHIAKITSGDHAAKTTQKLADSGWTMDDLRARWRIEADEQLLCLDATTGETLWKVDWPGEGLHYFDHKCSLTNWTGAIAGDLVCVLGGTGRLRAVDAKSGEERWAISVPGLSEQLGELREKFLTNRHLHAPTRSFCHALAVTGNLVLAPDNLGSCGIVGVELESGNVRWHVEGRILPTTAASPLVVEVDGKTLAICVGDGFATAIDCATGEIAWTSEAVGKNAFQAVLAGDRLIAQAMNSAGLEKENERYPKEKASDWAPDAVISAPSHDHGRIGCWRITSEGLEELWIAPAEWGATQNTPVGAVLGERLCFRGKYAYQIVDIETGERIARSYLSVPARMDEGQLLALPGMFIPHPDTQHGTIKIYPFPDRGDAKVGPLWNPPHPHATTYQVGMSHAWGDGRLFIRGVDAIYCYDLRKQ